MLGKDSKRAKVLGGLVTAVEKQHGKGALMALGTSVHENVEVIGSGCDSLNQALGCGGYPKGRVVEVYGPESGGKTTLTLHAIAECQARGGVAAFIDAEHALDPGYARKLGVHADDLLVSQPDCGEQALDIAETLVRSGEVGLVVVDSVAALVPRAEIDGDMGDKHLGLQARLMSQALRKLTGLAHKTGTTVMFINQLRHKIGVTFGSPEVTTGGNALKYYSSVRLDVRRIGLVKAGEDVVGHRVRVKVVKNKMAPPFQQTEFDLRYGAGIDWAGDLLDTGVDAGVVQKNGAHYAMDGDRLGHGREKARVTLLESSEQVARLKGQLAKALPTDLEKSEKEGITNKAVA